MDIIETRQGLARWEEAGEDVLAEWKKVLEEMKAELTKWKLKKADSSVHRQTMKSDLKMRKDDNHEIK